MPPKRKRGRRSVAAAEPPPRRPPPPHDVLVLLAGHLSEKRDLAAFSLVSRAFREAAEPLLYRELVFPHENVDFGPSCAAFMSLLQNLGDGRRFAHTRSIKAPWQAPPASMFDLLPLCTNLERLSLSALEIDELSVLARSCPSLVNVSVDVMCVRTGHIPDWGSLEPLPRREWALSVWYRLENEKSIPDGFDCDEAEAVLRGMIRWMPGLKSIDLAVPFTFYQEPSGDGFWNSAAPLLKRLTFIDHTVLEKLATTPGDPLSLMRPLELRIHQAVPATVAALQKLGQPPTKLSFIHSPMDYLLPLFGESPIEVSELFLFDCFFQGGIFGQIGADALRTMLDRSRIGSIVVFCNTLLAAPEKDVELWREVCGEAVVSNRGGKVEQTFTYRPRKSG